MFLKPLDLTPKHHALIAEHAGVHPAKAARWYAYWVLVQDQFPHVTNTLEQLQDIFAIARLKGEL